MPQGVSGVASIAGTGARAVPGEMRDGFQFQRRSVPDGVSRVAGRQQAVRAAYGRDDDWNGRGSRRIRPAEALGEEDVRRTLARAELAREIWRTRRRSPAEYRLWRGARSRGRVGADDRDGYQPVRTDAVALGDR